MKVLAITPPGDCPMRWRNGLSAFATRAACDDLFRRSDVVSLHCPLTPETHHLVNAQRLAMMKRSAYLINTGRGPLVDEAGVGRRAPCRPDRRRGLDVLSTEPPPPDNPLLTAPNCSITPHIAWATRAARERLLRRDRGERREPFSPARRRTW